MSGHTHGWPDERPDWRRRNYPLLVPPKRSLAWSVLRWLLSLTAWVGIWLLVGRIAPDTFDRFWLVIPLIGAQALGYFWRATE